MKKWLAGGLIFLIVSAGWLGVSGYLKFKTEERRAVIERRTQLEEKARQASMVKVETALAKLDKIGRLELEKLEEFAAKYLAGFSKGEREALLPVLRAKLFEANFRRAELYLMRAGDLLRVDNNHPTGKEYIERAWKLYAAMEKLMEQGIPERTGDTEGNARANYLKGVYFFGLAKLTFIRAKDPKEEAARLEELIGLSAKHLSTVFQYKPRDRDTEVALEILQKKAQSMGAGGNDDSAKLKLELLPSRGSNRGPTFAIEGFEEGRR